MIFLPLTNFARRKEGGPKNNGQESKKKKEKKMLSKALTFETSSNLIPMLYVLITL